MHRKADRRDRAEKVSQINDGAFEKASRNSGGGEGSAMTEQDRKENQMMDQGGTATEISAHPLQIEYWPLDRLIPYARNARTHSAAQIAEIAGSIRAFGFSNPILVGEGADVIAGHGRLAAARKLGLAEAPVVVLRGLSDAQRRRLVLADNKIALNANWDAEMLSLELADLSAIGADLSMLGFTTKELSAALSRVEAGLTDEDDVPEIAEVAVSKPGDIWQLGPHRIVPSCGHCAATDGHGPAIRRRVRSAMAPSPGCQQFRPKGQNQKRRNRGLDSNLGPVPRRDCLCLAWGTPLNHCCREPRQEPFFDPGADHLGEGAAGDESGRLPLAARALLVRCPKERLLGP